MTSQRENFQYFFKKKQCKQKEARDQLLFVCSFKQIVAKTKKQKLFELGPFLDCVSVLLLSPSTMGCPVVWPCSMSSYSTLKPDTVSEAETQEMTKLLEVISVTDSEVSTTGGGGVVSPWDVATAGEERRLRQLAP